MNALIGLLLVSIFTLNYFALHLNVISRYFTLIPDLLSGVILLLVIGRSLVSKRWQQPVKYRILLVVFTLAWLVSAVAESVAPGVLINGMRDYFKFFPLLFLPAVYHFSNKDLVTIIGTFLLLVAVQVPIAFYQRFVQFAGSMHTGDVVTGTVTTSSALTIVLCMAIAIVMILYVNRKISFALAAVLFVYFVAPTTINETKATIILMPIATLGPFLLVQDVTNKWKRLVPVVVLCAIGIVGFVAVYNVLIEARWWGGAHQIGAFFTEGHAENHLYRGVSGDNPPHVVGRLDSIILPVSILSENWMQLMFGLGPGNVSPSFLPGMEGEYFEQYKEFGVTKTAVAKMIWELGIVGLAIYGFFFFYMWRDARFLSKSKTDMKWLGEWWSVCTLIITLGIFYKNILNFNEVAYLMFFFTGVVAAQRMQVHGEVDGSSGIAKTKEASKAKLVLAGRPTYVLDRRIK